MYRFSLLIGTLVLGALHVQANSPSAAAATYVLQVSSNLGCETLDLELVSQSDQSSQFLKYSKGAFAAVTLSPGDYTFGDVLCKNQDGEQKLDILRGKIAPLQLTAGQAYFGGKLIFRESENKDLNAAPKVLSTCTNLISRARGERSNSCRDGVGVDTTAKNIKQIDVFTAKVSEEEINSVRKALSASKQQLQYLPLKV